MFLKIQKRSLAFLLALILVLSTFVSVAVIPASAAGSNYGVLMPGEQNLTETFDTLEKAVDFVETSGNVGWIITVLQDVVYDEACTIPEGTTLLIPFDDANTVYTNEDTDDLIVGDKEGETYDSPSPYRTFTMKSDSSLEVSEGGAICVGGRLFSKGQVGSPNGSPTGKHGRICMQGDSEIVISSGANLYAWGYIYASSASSEGEVTIENGGSVYEPFQILNYRGGGETGDCMSNGVFPFNQYYVQNVEVPMTLKNGATETAIAALTAGSTIYPVPVAFIGTDGMFVITDPNGYLVKDYLEASDRLDVQIYGDAQLSPMTLKDLPVVGSISSEDFKLPITNNISVEVKEGNTEINQDIILLPGTEMVVEEDAGVSITEDASVFVYDASDWSGSYVGNNSNKEYIGLPYTAAHESNTSEIRDNANPDGLPSAKVDINGDVVVRGGFYASGNADISSSENTGTITYATTAETSKTLAECSNNNSITPVEYGVAQLRKPDGTYENPVVTDPETGATYFVTGEYAYENEDLSFDQMYYVTWLNYEGDESAPLYVQSFKTGATPVYGGETPTHANTDQLIFGSFAGWATTKESNTAQYTNDNLPLVGTEDVIYYAAYPITQKVFTVKWNDKDGNELYTQNNVKYSDIDPSIHEAPELPATYSGNYISTSTAYAMTEYQEKYAGKALKTVYTFDEWSADYVYDDTTNEGVCTLTPLYNDVVQQLVLFVDGTGTDAHILDAQYYAAGTKIKPCKVYSGATPTKASDETYSYTYSGWQSSYSDSSNYTYALDNPDKQFTVADLTKTGSTGKINANKNTLVATFTQTEAVNDKHSLSLNGDIGVNFYHKLPAEYTSDDITADFSWGKTYTATNTYSDEPNTESDVTGTLADGVYVKFTLPIAIKNLNDEITVSYKAKANGEEIATDTYKPTDYAYQILGMTDAQIKPLLKTGQTAGELKELVRTMLIYAAAAQENFNYNTEHLATDKLGTGDYVNYSATVNAVNTNNLGSNNLNDLPDYLEYYGSSLNLGSKTAYDLCFINRSKTDLTTSATYANSEEAVSTSVRSNDIAYVVRLMDLPAAKVTENISLTINGSTVTVNAGEYIKAVLDNYNSGALYDTVTALYAYNQSAVAFFS